MSEKPKIKKKITPLPAEFGFKEIKMFYIDALNTIAENEGMNIKFLKSNSLFNNELTDRTYLKEYSKLINDFIEYNDSTIPFFIELKLAELDEVNYPNILNTLQKVLQNMDYYQTNNKAFVNEKLFYVDKYSSNISNITTTKECLFRKLDNNAACTYKNTISRSNYVPDTISEGNLLGEEYKYIRNSSRSFDNFVNSNKKSIDLQLFVEKYFMNKLVLRVDIKLIQVASRTFTNQLNAINETVANYTRYVDTQNKINELVFKGEAEYHKKLKEYHNITAKIKKLVAQHDDIVNFINDIVERNTDVKQENKAGRELDKLKPLFMDFVQTESKTKDTVAETQVLEEPDVDEFEENDWEESPEPTTFVGTAEVIREAIRAAEPIPYNSDLLSADLERFILDMSTSNLSGDRPNTINDNGF